MIDPKRSDMPDEALLQWGGRLFLKGKYMKKIFRIGDVLELDPLEVIQHILRTKLEEMFPDLRRNHHG